MERMTENYGSIPSSRQKPLFFQPMRHDQLWGRSNLQFNAYKGIFPQK